MRDLTTHHPPDMGRLPDMRTRRGRLPPDMRTRPGRLLDIRPNRDMARPRIPHRGLRHRRRQEQHIHRHEPRRKTHRRTKPSAAWRSRR